MLKLSLGKAESSDHNNIYQDSPRSQGQSPRNHVRQQSASNKTINTPRKTKNQSIGGGNQSGPGIIRTDSIIDSELQHWEEYKLNGRNIDRRCYHSAVTYNDYMYVYGGYEYNLGFMNTFYRIYIGNDAFQFVWEKVDTSDSTAKQAENEDDEDTQWKRTSGVSPGPLARHSAVVIEDSMYLYGGQRNAIDNSGELYEFKFKESVWEKIQPNGDLVPEPRDSHSALVWKQEDQATMVVFGGFIGGNLGEPCNEVLIFDPKQKTWEIASKNSDGSRFPKKRMGHASVIIGDELYVFSGTDGEIKFNDLWKFDLKARVWQSIDSKGTIPEARNGATLSAHKDSLILFGGIHELTHEKNDIYIYWIQGSTWEKIESESKFVRSIDQGESSALNSPLLRQPTQVAPKNKSRFEALAHQANNSDSSEIKLDQSRNDLNNMSSRILKSPKGITDRSHVKITERRWEKLDILEPLEKEKSFKAENSRFGGTVEERKIRDKHFHKMNLLNDLKVSEEERVQLFDKDPTTDAMKQSLLTVGDQVSMEAEGGTKKKVLKEFMRAASESKLNLSRVPGNKPRARDGHTACVNNEKVIIFGGDRHKMCFHDIFALNLSFLERRVSFKH